MQELGDREPLQHEASTLASEPAMVEDHWDNHTIDFVLHHLSDAKERIRIATGFFTIQGYDLIRSALVRKWVAVLVGYDEASKERLKRKLIDDIMTHLSLWDAANRREAVEDLVHKLEYGEFHLIEQGEAELLDARTRKRDHAKVFIVDAHKVLVGSSNLTVSGLVHNAEGVSCVDDPGRVAQWVQMFEVYWTAPETYDLTQALLEALRRWLGLRTPYDVYLKTIQALVPEDETEAPRDNYKMPVKYQLVVIERLLRQLRRHRGAMLVASTGLGKTIMATHAAYRLQQEGLIDNVLVFCPLQVQPDWERALRSAGLSRDVFTRNLLDRRLSDRRNSKKLRKIMDVLDEIDDKYIVFIDESQYFRNRLRARDGEMRYSFQRLVQAANRKKPYIVLLTATPFSKGPQDLNNQLYLLPHSAPPTYVQTDGQMVMEGIGDHLIEPRAWRVMESDDYFAQFMQLPVSTVISTSQVAKNFAIRTPQGDYVDFEDGRRWIPQIAIQKVTVPVPLEREMTEALDGELFRHKMRVFSNRGEWRRSESTIEEQATLAWASSPLALQEVLEKTIDGSYEAKFIYGPKERQERLTPVLQSLRAYSPDVKFLTLCYYLRQFHTSGKKVVVFTERLATAVYLEECLAREMPELCVANAVARQGDDYVLKEFEQVYDLILDFAPEANREKRADGRPERGFDVFITTDAYGVGVNLQDASVVISYDLAWTADTIIQRAGRILRFWHEPRQVSLYVFVGRFELDMKRKRASQRLEERLRKLTHRTRQAEQFSELPIIPEQDAAEYTSLSELSEVTIEDLGLADITEIEEFTGVSPFLRHITELQDHLDYALTIPDDIISAKEYPEKSALLYLLLRHERTYSWILYDVRQGTLRNDVQEDALLDMLQCTPEAIPASIDPNEIERLAQKAKRLWCEREGVIVPDSVERICAMYLQPQTRGGELSDMLERAVSIDKGTNR